MSTSEEINAVYMADINSQTHLVESKFGKAPFYDNFEGFSICDLFAYSGAERIVCSDYKPKVKRWGNKYGKAIGD